MDSMTVIRNYVEGQARLGYAHWMPGPDPSDLILATFPKSGSTWSSYLLHQLRSYGDDSFDDIKHAVVDITPGHWDPKRNPFIEAQSYFPRVYKTHGSYALAPKGARYIYVAREPKDIFWSMYHFIHDLFGLTEVAPIDLFYRDFFIERFNSDHDIGNPWTHLLSWFPRVAAGDLLWLHYEDLLIQREASLRRIADWMQVSMNDELLSVVVQNSRIEHMRSIADKINPSPDNYVGKLVNGFSAETQGYAKTLQFGKLRKGIAGDGRTSLPTEIADDIDAQWRERITPELGYESYADLLSACGLGANLLT